ncbi:Regulator of chromosome condensation, RCC1 [Dillenia turbinata]|uniref:Regulator of chromosome condensation, RCC1 n=1 Tax=Dillenia turbinata TaxID=194707 RepID=A0AAN8Z3P9_9MAGN
MLSGLRSSVRIRIGMGVWRQRRIRMLSSSSETNSESSNRRFAALWGNGDYGRLGLGSLDSQWTPVVCSSSAFHSQSLRSIACGGAHTLFLTEKDNSPLTIEKGWELLLLGVGGVGDAKSTAMAVSQIGQIFGFLLVGLLEGG